MNHTDLELHIYIQSVLITKYFPRVAILSWRMGCWFFIFAYCHRNEDPNLIKSFTTLIAECEVVWQVSNSVAEESPTSSSEQKNNPREEKHSVLQDPPILICLTFPIRPFLLTLNTEAAILPKTSVIVCRTTRLHIVEDNKLQSHRGAACCAVNCNSKA